MNDPLTPRRLRGPLTLLLVVWIGAWLWLTRQYMLDDALIHLRFAYWLHARGFLTFDGVTPSYGVSSLLYVGLLSALQAFWYSPFLPKVVSDLAYVTLLWLVWRRQSRAQGTDRVAWLALLLVLAGPMAIRWLTDGMETSLVVALALTSGLYAGDTLRAAPAGPRGLAGRALAGAILVLARVELVALAGAAAAVEAARGLAAAGRATRQDGLARAVAWLAGALAAVGAIWWALGAVLPDTAVAKSLGFLGLAAGLRANAATHVGALSLGVGLVILWVVTTVRAVSRADAGWTRWGLTAANLIVPAVIAAAIWRGQALQGVRYFLPSYAFTIALNISTTEARGRPAPGPAGRAPVPVARRRLLALGAAALLTVWAFEGTLVWRIARDRRQMFLDMSRQRLAALSDQAGMAFNIGFIAYFTDARICDLSGLVNGRALAAQSPDQRLAACLARSPTFAYVTDNEWAWLRRRVDIATWRECHQYVSRNAFTVEGEHLLVAPEVAARVCGPGSAGGGTSPTRPR